MGMRIYIWSYGNWKLLMLLWEFEYAYGVLLVKRLLTPKISCGSARSPSQVTYNPIL